MYLWTVDIVFELSGIFNKAAASKWSGAQLIWQAQVENLGAFATEIFNSTVGRKIKKKVLKSTVCLGYVKAQDRRAVAIAWETVDNQ